MVKDALRDISVFLYIAIRFGLAATVMGVLFWRSVRSLSPRAVCAGAQIGLFMLGGYIFQTAGLKYTTPSKAAFITGSSVVLVPLLLAAFGLRRITSWIWMGAIAAFAGLYLLTVPQEGRGVLNGGDPLVFVCAVMFALHIIFVGRHIEHYSVGALSFVQVATTAVLSAVLLPISSATHWEVLKLHWTGSLVVAILVTAIGSTVIAFSLQVWAQQYASPSHTAILVSLEPVFAAITSLLLAREHFGARTVAGAILVFAGIVLAELKGPAPVAAESPEPGVPFVE
jgi:drug/metabolite transporter (DMT)-like permease